MLILLPPSETKRPGGEGAPWDASRLAFSELTPIRESVIDALVRLSDDPDAAAKVLKLGPKQRGEIETNRSLRTSPTMPAIVWLMPTVPSMAICRLLAAASHVTDSVRSTPALPMATLHSCTMWSNGCSAAERKST